MERKEDVGYKKGKAYCYDCSPQFSLLKNAATSEMNKAFGPGLFYGQRGEEDESEREAKNIYELRV